jgi:hypothetical protein
MRHFGMLDGDATLNRRAVPAFALPADTRGVCVR